MSNFSNAHNVTAYDSKKSEALTGQRLAKCKYKTTVKTPAKYPSVCASVPFLKADDVTPHLTQLMGHIGAMLETAQDGILKSLYETSDGALSVVTDADISVTACIAFMDAVSQGNRLTSEFIEAWFVESVQDYLVAMVTEKLKYDDDMTPEQEKTVMQHVNGYKGLYSSLAGGKTILMDKQIKSLQNVLGLIDSDDTCEKLKARLSNMANKPKLEELLEL